MIMPCVPQEQKFFFIRGHNRSGTNWIGHVLNLHPQIFCTGEFYFVTLQKKLVELQSVSWCKLHEADIGKAAHAAFEEFTKTVMVFASQKEGKSHVAWLGDRTPQKIYPMPIHDAPVFLMVRDGRDVLVSWTYHLLHIRHSDHFVSMPLMRKKIDILTQDPDYFLHHPHELLDCESWVRSCARSWNAHVMEDVHYIENAGSSLRQRIKVVQYEQLHAHTEQMRTELYEFLDLPASVAAPLDSGTVPGCPRPDSQGMRRRGMPRQWPAYFTDATEQWFLDGGSEALQYYGYI